VDERVPSWVRLGMIVTLAVPQLLIGLWAYVAPESWFDSFPGFDPRLVAALPPYNEHLASDVGAGFLSTGTALLVAAIWANRTGVRVALIAFAAFTVPHVAYHVAHPADVLSTVENATNVLALATTLVLAALFAFGSTDRSPLERAPACEPL
jgi:hypothetical protein